MRFMCVILFSPRNSSLQLCLFLCAAEEPEVPRRAGVVRGMELEEDGRPGIKFMSDCVSFCEMLLQQRRTTVNRSDQRNRVRSDCVSDGEVWCEGSQPCGLRGLGPEESG